MESELDSMQSNILISKQSIASKIERDELTKVWDHFQRFAEYKDLKHLHTIVIPEIAKFEQKIMVYQKKLDQYDEIIRNYDEVIQTKSNKTVMDQYKAYVKSNHTTHQ